MPEWLQRFPTWWQVLVAMATLFTGALGGSLATARWFGWQDWGPSQRLAAIEVRDSLQDLRLSATRDSLRGELRSVQDSVWGEIRDLRQAQEGLLRLQCVQSPEVYRQLARVRC